MTTQEIYNAGMKLVHKFAVMTYRDMNNDPYLEVSDYMALLKRVKGFFAWADANGKGQDLRFACTHQNVQTNFEYDHMVENLKAMNIF